MWRLHTPKQGTGYHTLLFEQATLSVYTLLSICLPNYLTARIKNKAFQTYLPGTTGMILYPGSYTYLPFPFRNIGSSHKGPPMPDTYRSGRHQTDMPVQSRPRIPTGRFRLIFQTYCQNILSTVIPFLRQVKSERGITIRPLAYICSVQINFRQAHRPVKFHPDSLSRHGSIRDDLRPIVSDSESRQSPRTPGTHFRSLITVLQHLYGLHVNTHIKRMTYRPVMRYTHPFPTSIIKRRADSLRNVSQMKFPGYQQ